MKAVRSSGGQTSKHRRAVQSWWRLICSSWPLPWPVLSPD